MTGKTAQNSGENGVMPLHITFYHALRMLFFSERSLRSIFSDSRHTYNLVTFYLLMLMIPSKGLNGEVHLFDLGYILEAVTLTFVYLCFLYLFFPLGKGGFMGMVRVMMAVESVDIPGAVTMMLSGDVLKYTVAIILAWFLSLTAFACANLSGHGYVRAGIAVFLAFFTTNLVPACFMM